MIELNYIYFVLKKINFKLHFAVNISGPDKNTGTQSTCFIVRGVKTSLEISEILRW